MSLVRCNQGIQKHLGMTTREDKEFYVRLWQQQQMLNNGCGTPMYIAVIVFVVLLLSSCATKKHIVENDHQKTEIRVDSTDVQVVKVDSTDTTHKTDVKETEKVETETKVEKSDSTVMTVDQNGNVIKQETWHKEKETVSRNREYEKQLLDSIARFKHTGDSLRQYVARCDSLQEQLSHKEYTVVEKTKIPKWCWYCLGFSIISFIFAFVKLARWLRIF